MPRRFIFLTIFQIVVSVILIREIFVWPGEWNGQRYVGSALVIVGLAFILVARYQLGRSFAVKAEAHQLVTHGLYSKIRNPIYVFGTVLIAGILLIFQKPIYWLFLVVVVIVQIIRARREAQVLEAAFGEQYREYRRQTWF